MKNIIIMFLLLATAIFGQTQSNIKPDMFSYHQGSDYFSTAVVNNGDTLYTYQFVPIESITESEMLDALLKDFDNRTDGDITFQQYRARCIERVNYALTGTVNLGNAGACGINVNTVEEFKDALGVNNYR